MAPRKKFIGVFSNKDIETGDEFLKCSELDLLDKIEEQEIKSLQWGYVDGFVQEEEVIKTAQDLGANDAFEWISNLKSKNLIIEVEYGEDYTVIDPDLLSL